MNESERIAEVQRWLRYARQDPIAAEVAVEQPQMAPRHACWLAQQAAENLTLHCN